MKKNLVILFLFIPYWLKAQCRIDYSNYHLVLYDEFNTTLADVGTRWFFSNNDSLQIGAGKEYYDPGQVSLLPGGILRLKAERVTPFIDNRSGEDRLIEYKSGILRSKIPYDVGAWGTGYKYGIFEMRAKIPNGRTAEGTGEWDAWPAFWLSSGPTEIDIIDDIQPDPSRVLQMAVIDWNKPPHSNPTDWDLLINCKSYPGNPLCSTEDFSMERDYPINSVVKDDNKVYKSNKAIKKCIANIFATKRMDDLSSTYNTYTAVWTPTKVTFFFNGIEVATISSSNIQTYDHPAWVLANLEIMEGAQDPSYDMDIDYIKIWKPNNNDYTLPYKSTAEHMNHDLKEEGTWNPVPAIPGLENVSSDQGSIALNPSADEVFYRSFDNALYHCKKEANANKWNINLIEPGAPAAFKAASDIKYFASKNMLIYIGNDQRLQCYKRTSSSPTVWTHSYLGDNFSSMVNLAAAVPSSLEMTSDGDIFYKGNDGKMHRCYYQNVAGTWAFQIIPQYASNEGILGDIVIDASKTVFYKGTDLRLHAYYLNNGTYVHTWIDGNFSASDKLINPTPGSIVLTPQLPGPAGGGISYIGQDNKIHRFYYNVNWQHEVFPYAYGNPNLGYPNGDKALSNLTWDGQSSFYYAGFDGRIQSLRKFGSTWDHYWIDNYFYTDEFQCANSSNYFSPPYYSLASSVLKANASTYRLYYRNKEGHLDYFTYENCEILDPPVRYFTNLVGRPAAPEDDSIFQSNANGSRIQRLFGPNSKEIAPEKIQDIEHSGIEVLPNPSLTGLFNIKVKKQNSIDGVLEVYSADGRKILRKKPFSSTGRIDLSDESPGLYILIFNNGIETIRTKIIKQ